MTICHMSVCSMGGHIYISVKCKIGQVQIPPPLDPLDLWVMSYDFKLHTHSLPMKQNFQNKILSTVKYVQNGQLRTNLALYPLDGGQIFF